MGDRSNRSLAFPVVAPGGGSTLVRVTVWLEEGEDSFRFGRHCHARKDTEETVDYFRQMTARRFWPEHVQSQRRGLRVSFYPEGQRSYVGESYGLLAILADMLATTRPELFWSDYDNGQKDLAIVATGEPNGEGALVLNDAGQNVGGLEAKLRAVLADGEEMFGQHAEKLLVVPRQTPEGEEAVLIAELQAKGWIVVQTSNLAETIRGGLLAPEGGEARSKVHKDGWLTWQRIGAGACLAAVLAVLGLWQGREEPPVSASLLKKQPEIVIPQVATAANTDPVPVIYSGALSVGVKLVRDEKTYDAPVGNPFMSGETVRLIVTHTGGRPALAVLYRGEVAIKDLVLVPGQAEKADFTLRDLVDRSGKAIIAVADCAEVDCASARALLRKNADATTRSYPVGDFRGVRADPDSRLKTVLKFEML
jgi:hypothetical protein